MTWGDLPQRERVRLLTMPLGDLTKEEAAILPPPPTDAELRSALQAPSPPQYGRVGPCGRQRYR